MGILDDPRHIAPVLDQFRGRNLAVPIDRGTLGGCEDEVNPRALDELHRLLQLFAGSGLIIKARIDPDPAGGSGGGNGGGDSRQRKRCRGKEDVGFVHNR